MTGKDIPKTLIKLIEKWMNNKKTDSLQINFIKGEISNLIEHRAISLKNNDSSFAPLNKGLRPIINFTNYFFKVVKGS